MFALFALFACIGTQSDPGPTYWQDARPVLEKKCAGCHQDGDIGPFALTDYDDVVALKEVVADSIASNRMPPWKATDGCNDYANDIGLEPEEKTLLLDWLDNGAAEGDPATATPVAERTAQEFVPDRVLTLPEPITPGAEDDYVCQIVDLDGIGDTYVTGFTVMPDRKELVHHVIAFTVGGHERERFEAMDAAFDGPGYPCFGSPIAAGFETELEYEDASLLELLDMFASGEAIEQLGGFGWLGSWAPGVGGGSFPNGTGIRVNDGDFLVVQMHYNTAVADPQPDQSSFGVTFSDTVQRPAMILPYTDPAWIVDIPMFGEPMSIPAGDDNVTHSTTMPVGGPLFAYARNTLGLEGGEDLLLHHVGTHMHTLGTEAYQGVKHDDGTETCLVDIADWDFGWQGGVSLREPLRIGQGDELQLSCTWDNSASNQPVINGSIPEPIDVQWGEGTRDEMCLGVLFISGL